MVKGRTCPISSASPNRGGRSTSVDAELAAIRLAVCKALSLPDCETLYLFSDCLPAMQAALDCSEHGGQAHSLAVCCALFDWLPALDRRHLVLIHSPSHLKWGPQGEAHDYICSLP